MGMLDDLIDKKNRDPEQGVGYIYGLDMVWKSNYSLLKSETPIEIYKHVAINVVREENCSFTF